MELLKPTSQPSADQNGLRHGLAGAYGNRCSMSNLCAGAVMRWSITSQAVQAKAWRERPL